VAISPFEFAAKLGSIRQNDGITWQC